MEEVEREFEPARRLTAIEGIGQSAAPPGMRYFLTRDEQERVRNDVARDEERFQLARQDFLRASELIDMLQRTLSEKDFPRSRDVNGDGLIDDTELPVRWREILRTDASENQPRTYSEVIIEARDGILDLREGIPTILKSLQVIQAGLRVEQIALNRFVLPGGTEFPDISEVVRIGLERRHDLMNARAVVMDARRAVEVAASELEATLDVTISGALGTAATSRKPFDFSGSSASYNAGLAFDTPADKMAERNAYNAALIEYQRARRAYMAAEDQVKQEIRTGWRQLKVSEQRLEIDRQAVRVAATQLDIAAFNATGQGEGNALNLLNALDSVLNAQNSLLNDWITWERNRLNIYRDMGIMEIDERGLWTDPFYRELPGAPATDSTGGRHLPSSENPTDRTDSSVPDILPFADTLPPVADPPAVPLLPVLTLETDSGDPE